MPVVEGGAGLVVLGEGVLVDARMHCQQRIDDFVRSGTGSYKVIFIRDRDDVSTSLNLVGRVRPIRSVGKSVSLLCSGLYRS
jgi:hypothetical protein